VPVFANGFVVGLAAGAFDMAGLSVFAPAFGLETVLVDEAVLAAGALGAPASAALAFAFVGGVVFVAFATRFLPAVIDWPNVPPDAGNVLRSGLLANPACPSMYCVYRRPCKPCPGGKVGKDLPPGPPTLSVRRRAADRRRTMPAFRQPGEKRVLRRIARAGAKKR
jgi:hypothetical protein